ncbi:aspartate/glutamate racemase family protein [Pseudonocardia acaciae]|uniref:aspartate/glutamate racemase family protein n=1 Tax=Pseudonocardia acaciae TaxID=551276 RepID=UPI00048FC7A5|nr:aspartate/glutamate racemase family protein [Pseudonocardia acaciae]
MTGPTPDTTRIWVQSVTDLSVLPLYAQQLEEHAARCVRPSTVVDVHGVAPGTYPEGVPPVELLRYPAAEYLLGVQLLRNAGRAEQEGYHAFAVSCFFDPVLAELRGAVDIPVVSLCESTLMMSAAAGCHLGLIGIAESNKDRLVDLVGRYGFAARVAAIVEVDPPIGEDEMHRAYGDPALLLPRFEAAAGRCADAAADLLIPAEGVLNSLLTRGGIGELAGIPVVDAFAALLAHAEALAWLSRNSGLTVSHRHGYARAPAEMMDAVSARAREALAESATAVRGLRTT